jgi:hypothetical protein
MHLRVDYAGVRITVTSESESAEPLVRLALADMNASEVREVGGTHLTVGGRQGAWRVTDHANARSRSPRTSGDLIYHLTDRLIHHVALAASRHHCLHAAAVSHRGRALIMPAGTGSGKSLLTAWLVASGFEYLTDELILVDDGYGIGGIARPIQIKRRGLPIVSQLIDKGKSVIPGTRSNSVPVAHLGGRSSSVVRHALGLVVFPEFKQGSGYELSPLTAAAAGMKFMSSHINARNLEGHGFRPLMEMVRTTRCYALKYGGFEKLPADFASRLRERLD